MSCDPTGHNQSAPIFHMLKLEMGVGMQSSLSAPFPGCIWVQMGFPGGSDVKESACNAGDLGLSPESGRAPGEGNGYHSGGAWWVTVHRVAKSWTQLSD